MSDPFDSAIEEARSRAQQEAERRRALTEQQRSTDALIARSTSELQAAIRSLIDRLNRHGVRRERAVEVRRGTWRTKERTLFEGWQIAEKPDYKLIFGKSPIPIWITTDGRISFSNEPPMSPAEFVRGLYKHDFSLAQRHAGIVQTPEELIALMGDFIVSRGL